MIAVVAPLAVMERAIHKTVRTRATCRRLTVGFSKSMDHHQTDHRQPLGLGSGWKPAEVAEHMRLPYRGNSSRPDRLRAPARRPACARLPGQSTGR
jgi:hypothetical protein